MSKIAGSRASAAAGFDTALLLYYYGWRYKRSDAIEKMLKRTDRKDLRTLGKQGKITALRLLKSFYDEEVFRVLVKHFYDSDTDVSQTAILSSGSLGNEIAIPHLYQIIERGVKSQRIAAIQTLAAIRAPSSTVFPATA